MIDSQIKLIHSSIGIVQLTNSLIQVQQFSNSMIIYKTFLLQVSELNPSSEWDRFNKSVDLNQLLMNQTD